ncbi:MAG: hypothetical protein OWU33_13425 [Firmicutes bacterium]|nr:hypothetical protein [Bacillota bacterium]
MSLIEERHIELEMDADLKTRIETLCIRDGRLFGTVPQASLTTDEVMQLARVGWHKRDYQDTPVMEPPQSTIDWWHLKAQHRDQTLHAISHRLQQGAPWIGTRQEILEELLASTWDVQEDELRTLLHAFAFASLWSHEEAAEEAIESRETFFFYTDRMRQTALKATQYAVKAPEPEDPFWEMVASLHDWTE